MSDPLVFHIIRWCAWAPGLSSVEDWRHWCAAPVPLLSSAAPALSFIDPLLRRKASQLSRMSLEVAFRCLPGDDLRQVPAVFGSRHGECRTSQKLLESLARSELLSPMAFSLSVHNTAAGLFSIAAGNRRATTAVAANRDTFCYSLLEALGALHREEKILLVVGEELVPDNLVPVVLEPRIPYALGVLIGSGAGVNCMQLRFSPQRTTHDRSAEYPQALAFVAWLLSGEPRLQLDDNRLRWELFQDGFEAVKAYAEN